jgi:hypothetical protein
MIATKTERGAKGKALALGFLLAALLVAMLLTPRLAYADTFTVNSTGDDGDVGSGGVCNTRPSRSGPSPSAR